MPGAIRSTGSSSSDRDGVVGRALQRGSDRVEREAQVLPGAGDRLVAERLRGDRFDAGVDGRLGGGGVAVGDLDGVGEADDEGLDHVRMLVQVLGGDDEVGRHEVALGPDVGLVDEHVAAALEHEAGRPRLGHPGAVEGAGLEGGERVGVVLRRDVHVAATAGVGRVALFEQPGPQRDVLGVAERRAGERDAGEVGRRRRCPRGRRATRRPTWCRRRSGWPRRRTWRRR